MENDTCYVITGLIHKEYLKLLIESYKDIKHKIVSTWYDQDEKSLNKLRENNFLVVQDNYPKNNKQTNYQSKAIYNGCLKAKELGFKYVIRMRTDIICNKSVEFVNLLKTQYFPKNKMVSFCGIETQDGVYFYDVMIAGKIDEVTDFFKNEQSMDDNRYIEKYLLEMKLNKTNITRDDVVSIFNFCYKSCEKSAIYFLFLKYDMEIITTYCNYLFVYHN